MKDLFILAADQNMSFFLRAVTDRFPHVLGTRPLTMDIVRHPERDPGCFRSSQDFLRPFLDTHGHCLVVLDRQGCGQEHMDREAIEQAIEDRLAQNGWRDRAAAVAIDPELENWMWVKSPHLARALNWESFEALESWAQQEGWLDTGASKPVDPKATIEAALRRSRTPRSSSIYQQVGAQASFRHCIDPAFAKLQSVFQAWFFPG